MPFDILTEQQAATKANLVLLGSNAHLSAYHFRAVEITKNNQTYTIIKLNNFIVRLFYYLFKTEASMVKDLEKVKASLLDHEISAGFKVEDFKAEDGSLSDLFSNIQKYNQAIAIQKNNKHSISTRLGLEIIKVDNLKDHIHFHSLEPAVLKEVTFSKKIDFGDDAEYITNKENFYVPIEKEENGEEKGKTQVGLFDRFVTSHDHSTDEHGIVHHKGKKFHHHDDHQNRGLEALSIFFRTQGERFLSLVGKGLDLVGLGDSFKKYHYFKDGKTDESLRADHTPLIDTDKPHNYNVGHATNLMSIPVVGSDEKTITNFTVITDPVEGDLAALIYPRMTKEGRLIEEAPAINVYVLSHNHLDHYSAKTIDKLLSQQPVMLVPQGDLELYTARGFKNVYPMNWGERANIVFEKEGLDYTLPISFAPARHWAGQICGGKESLFGGYIVHTKDGDIFYRGDSATLSDEEIEVLVKHYNIIALIEPGGPDEDRDLMKGSHQSSADALAMHFKVLIRKLVSKKEENSTESDKDFIMHNKDQVKTFYTHNKTFKLGELHYDDTEASMDRIVQTLRGETLPADNLLRGHEQEVIDTIKQEVEKYELTDANIAEIIETSIKDPKIGERFALIA